MKAVLPALAAALLAGAVLGAPLPHIAVAKYSKGVVGVVTDSAAAPLEGSDLLPPGVRIESGPDGKAVLRLLPDQAFLEIRPQTTFTAKRVKVAGKRMRRLLLESGEVAIGLKKKSDPVQCENTHTLATGTGGRFSCKTDEKAVARILVQDGEVTVYNRPKDMTAVVRKGQKAQSDLDGIRVSDATDSELESVGFRQNIVEIDFLNPSSEEFSTLEVEYETNF